MRGSKVKKLRKMYRAFREEVSHYDLPEGARLISFRVFRKRVCARR